MSNFHVFRQEMLLFSALSSSPPRCNKHDGTYYLGASLVLIDEILLSVHILSSHPGTCLVEICHAMEKLIEGSIAGVSPNINYIFLI